MVSWGEGRSCGELGRRGGVVVSCRGGRSRGELWSQSHGELGSGEEGRGGAVVS